jgi:adenine specific DNA methylase Mod
MANGDSARKKDSARLVWDSKPRRAPNPRDIEFQTAEIVIPNPQRDLQQLPFGFNERGVREDILQAPEIVKAQMNRLIWGDNLLAMQALLAQGYEGKVNLVYIDPPFDSKADYSYSLLIAGQAVTKEPSVIERLAYKDTWEGGTDSYLDMLYPRLQLIKRLLADNGSLFVHLDWHAGHYIKVLLDEVFGRESMVNEIVWCDTGPGSPGMHQFNRKHDTIFWFRKGQSWKFNENEVRVSHDEKTLGFLN